MCTLYHIPLALDTVFVKITGKGKVARITKMFIYINIIYMTIMQTTEFYPISKLSK